MDYKEALAYIDGVAWFGSKPGLSRVTELLHALGDPQDRLKFVHIAGTNGKGSCAAMLASVLKAAGYKTGLFTSPYLYRFNERMQINGEEIGNEVLADIVTRVSVPAEKMEDHPTEFELMTAAAMLWYAEAGCDIVVLETGLGGRFDATNVISRPEVSVIMNIGLDHTKVLGDTVEQIAAEKAGIIKPGCPCVLYQQSESVTRVIRDRCAETGSALTVADFSAIKTEFDRLEGQVFTYKGDAYAIPLLGAHQRKNAAVVIEATEVLRRRGWKLPQEDVEHGLYAVSWPARFEPVSEEPYFIVDGGHNPQCAQAIARSLERYFPGKKILFLMGVLADKDFEGICDALLPLARRICAVTPDSPRALAADKLCERLANEYHFTAAKPYGSVADALKAVLAAAGEDDVICVCGSLYMIGEARRELGLR